MNIKQYLDSTYLKTATQAGVSKVENDKIVIEAIQEAIDHDFKLIMIRPEYVKIAKEMITNANSKVTICLTQVPLSPISNKPSLVKVPLNSLGSIMLFVSIVCSSLKRVILICGRNSSPTYL